MRAHNFLDRTGVRFGKLVAISCFKKPEWPKRTYWNCVCDCGKEIAVQGGHLQMGHTVSCGCAKADLISAAKTTHGHTANHGSTKEYSAWLGMKNRCYNPNYYLYHHYGGKGVTVCQKWLDSFESFLADMGNATDGYSLERKNTAGNYESDNCKWADAVEQQNNKTNNVKITYDGKTLSTGQWARVVGICHKRIWARVKAGWSPERILTTPSSTKARKLKHERETS